MIKYLKDDDDLKKIISSDRWLIDFYAEWCGPCKILGETLETISDINILKINVDLFPLIAKEFGVMSIPTIYFSNNGVIKDRHIGLISKEDIKKIIKDI